MTHWLPVYRCRLCARVWTGAYPIADLPERAAATPQGTVPHLCEDRAVGVADVVGFRMEKKVGGEG